MTGDFRLEKHPLVLLLKEESETGQPKIKSSHATGLLRLKENYIAHLQQPNTSYDLDGVLSFYWVPAQSQLYNAYR